MHKNLLFIPGPVTVAEPVLAAMARPLDDHRGPDFAAMLGRIERGMQPIFGTNSEVVVLGCSGSGGLEAAVASAFSPGEHVLACPVGVFGKRLVSIAKTYGLVVDTIDTVWGHAVDPAVLAAKLREPGSQRYAGILLTHNETSTGVQNDMAALSAAIGSHPALRVVDSVSGLGASPFEMDAWGFDIVVTASQKALSVPPGLAMVAFTDRAWTKIAAATIPRFYSDLQRAREFKLQGQTPWTPPVSICYALDVAIELYHAEGKAAVFARHASYRQAIHAAAAALGIEVFSQPGAHSVTVVAMHLPAGIEAGKLRATLREKYGIVMGGGQAELKGKILRMGTMGAISQADVLGALGALEMALIEHGYGAAIPGAGVRAAQEIFLGRSSALVPA